MISSLVKRASYQLRLQRHLILPGLVIALAILASTHFIVSCTSSTHVVVAPPSVPGATFVGNETCATCHADVVKVFHGSDGSVHSRVHAAHGLGGKESSCESCHGPGSKHVDSGGGTTFKRLIVNPGKSSEACFRCHVGVHAEFRLPSHHPVLEGKMNCVDCHDPHGQDIMKPAGGLGMAKLNESCAKCHKEQTGHFVFEHEAMREGCTACHVPHGSVNSKLLLQRDANSCLKCHAQVPGAGGSVVIGEVDHSFFLRQGNCSTSGCHTAVHGSNIHPKLLY